MPSNILYMLKEINPFIVIGEIEPQYFCDRVQESSRLLKSITNGNNMVVISPRRMGKTGLIRFCYNKLEIRKNYYTFFIDILHTSSISELTYILGKEIYETLLPRSKKMALTFVRALKSINGNFGFDTVTNMPTFNVSLGDINRPEYTLEEIFNSLAAADKPCIVAIDEFQQISKYSEKNIEALLRTYIQKISNTHFIFAGSERSMMQTMFLSSSRPFYRSADIMELNAIDKDIYVPFIVEQFKSRKRKIDSEDVDRVYDMFRGHTFYIQKTFNEAFADTPIGNKCTMETISTAIDSIIAYNETTFREILSNIPEKQKMLLYAIAAEGEAKQVLSGEFINRYGLSSSSSVQSATRKLLDQDLITETDKVYSVTDKLFAMWINKIYGIVRK